MKKEKLLARLAILYFMVGFIFAICFAFYYRWDVTSFLSPGFYSVILTWPIQSIGFINDLLIYGLAGKPV